MSLPQETRAGQEGEEEEEEEKLHKINPPNPPSKLRARIMATSYKYKLLDEQSDMHFADKDYDSGCPSGSPCLKKLVVLLLFLVVALGVVVIILGIQLDMKSSDETETYLENTKVCFDTNCVQTSASILSKMNLSVEPCQDLYQYACGQWIHDNPPPPDKTQVNSFSEVAEKNEKIIRQLLESEGSMFDGKNSSAISKLKNYYHTCMDEDTIESKGIKDVLKVIASIGSWTLSPDEELPAWNRKTWNLQKALASAHLLGGSAFFGTIVSADDKNTNNTIIKFAQSGLTLQYPKQYTNADSKKFKDAFITLGTKLAVLLGGEETDARAKVEQMYVLEKELAKINLPRENMTNPLNLYNKMTLQEFQNLLGPWIDIRAYLSQLFQGREFKTDENVIILTVDYFQKLRGVIDNTDKEVLANYVVWSVFKHYTFYLPADFSKALLKFSQVLNGISSLPPRWKRCIVDTEEVLGFASSALYVKENFSPDSKSKVVYALDQIRRAFIANLDSVTWLDDVTKAVLKDKAEYMTNMVGYPDWIIDHEQLDKYYEKLDVTRGEFLTNKISANNFETQRAVNKYGKPPERFEWHMRPDEVNAYYTPSFNYVVIPAGILQPPFFNPSFPQPFLYGTIGMIVGHELTHGFDNQGRYYDKYGNLGDIWKPETGDAFKSKAECMVNQYNSYSIYGKHLKGTTTLGENIADNGGLRLAYQAFHKTRNAHEEQLPGLDLTSDQMFFLGFSQIWCASIRQEETVTKIETDVHSIHEFRVKGAASNSPEFAQAFDCPVGSPMNPEGKCRVW